MYHIKDDKRSKLSCQLIYGALSRLMEQKSYENISITEIVKEAQVGRATFYRNFDSKLDVLTYISDMTFEGLLKYLIKYYDEKKVRHNSEFLIPFLLYFDDNSLIVTQLLKARNQDVLSDSLKKIFIRFRSQFFDAAEDPDNAWDYFVAIRTGITINILVQWIHKGKNISPEKLGELISRQLKQSFTVDQFL